MIHELDLSRLDHLADVRARHSGSVRRLSEQTRALRARMHQIETDLAGLAEGPHGNASDGRRSDLETERADLAARIDRIADDREQASASYRQATQVLATCTEFARATGHNVPEGLD